MDRPRSHSLARAFACAFRGMMVAVSGRMARIQMGVAFIAVAAGIFFQIERWEWVAVVMVIGLVLGLEIVNSSIERLADAVTEETRPHIRDAKDMAAGAVLLASLAALAVGALVFVPKILAFFAR